ncbi:MAG: dephospho-CoA kinase [Cellvibrionaceae bacterium]|nr:dephospho-CoA kinase [Cellvibrionaceae bacterium]
MADFIVGLTGGIGSGKTAVSDRFAKLGIAVIDADIAARVVVAPGRPALVEIAARFGDKVLLQDGSLNRARLREIVFAEPSERLWLESVTHPRIRDEITDGLSRADSPYAILVSPLLMETDQHQLCQRVLLVDVPENVQLERASARDGVSREQIEAIMAAQTSRDARRAKADDIIVNDRDLAWLDSEVARLHQLYLSCR